MTILKNKRILIYLAAVFIVAVIAILIPGSDVTEETGNSVAGTWRGVLVSPGGELPFFLDIEESPDNVLNAFVRNGVESLPFSSVDIDKGGREIRLVFEHYDSIIYAGVAANRTQMDGTWSKRSLGGKRTEMTFFAQRIQAGEGDSLFPLLPEDSNRKTSFPKDISGEWVVEFTDDDGVTPAKAIFSQKGTSLAGTFLTRVGDYRFLAGSYQNGRLRLSVFDGAHAFLFRATIDAKGIFHGDFWSRDSYHATWTARKGSVDMPDPYSLTQLTNDEKRFSFNFPGLDGKPVSEQDPRFKGKVLIVYIFGTWCPNCNDEAPFLEELYRDYHERGLEIVGLANEFTGEFNNDSTMVRRYIKKYDLSWPILIVGIADKVKTTESLKDLDRVLAYPTTIFMDRQKKVYKIYTGFSGPGTGTYYQTLRSEFRQIVETLLGDN